MGQTNHTLRELLLKDVKVVLLTDGKETAEARVVTAEELEQLKQEAEEATGGN